MTFQREVLTPDGYGGHTKTWETVATVWGAFLPQRGRDVIEAGSISGAVQGVLRVRYSAQLADLGPTDSVLIDGQLYNLAIPTNTDQRKRGLEFVVERGRAV